MTYLQERQRREFNIEEKGEPPLPAFDRKISPEELKEHKSAGDTWIALHGMVLDVSSWIGKHPGGRGVIENVGGSNATKVFEKIHGARGPLIMIAGEYANDVKIIGEYDDPNAGDDNIDPKTLLAKEYLNQSEQNHAYIIKGAVEFEEEIQLGKSEVVKVTHKEKGPVSTIFMSAQVPSAENIALSMKRPNPLKDQADACVNNMRDELEKVGATLDDVVKINAYIVDIDKEKIASLARTLSQACQGWAKPWDLLSMGAKQRRYSEKDDPRGLGPGMPAAFTFVGATGFAVENQLIQIEAVAVIAGKGLSPSKL